VEPVVAGHPTLIRRSTRRLARGDFLAVV